MGKTTGFIEYERQEPGYRPVEERTSDYQAVENSPFKVDLTRQAARCMDCGIPFCHGCGCPLGNVIPEFNDLVYRDKWREAWQILSATNNFPEFTGRVCPAPCEAACVLGINQPPVTIRQIELAVVERAFEEKFIAAEPPADRFPEQVAVIGSGPAGLTVADTLNRRGFPVTVFDNAPAPGGILRYGIPQFKLEKWVIDRRLDLMRREGIKFENGVRVGADISYRYLKNRFAAICLCSGARKPRELTVPGRDSEGIFQAMAYLQQQNLVLEGADIAGAERIDAGGRRVLVIGGGDTGSDCVGTAIRQGAKSVTQVEIMPRPPDRRSPATPWPLWPTQLRTSSSQEEGCERLWGVATESFSAAADGRVKEVRAVKVEWTRKNGRPVMGKLAGTEFKIEADLVLLAMGFTGPRPNPMLDDLEIERDNEGVIQRNADSMTNAPGIFVAGDMSTGASLVVRAMADGRNAADGICRFLQPGN